MVFFTVGSFIWSFWWERLQCCKNQLCTLGEGLRLWALAAFHHIPVTAPGLGKKTSGCPEESLFSKRHLVLLVFRFEQAAWGSLRSEPAQRVGDKHGRGAPGFVEGQQQHQKHPGQTG